MAKLKDQQRIEDALRHVSDEASFIQHLLIGALDWPIESKVDDLEEITYGWSQQDLRAAGLDGKLVEGQVRQIANLDVRQPWGIFILEFRRPDAFLAERGMAGTLRKVLRGLVPSRRKESGLSSWKREHLLFICTHRYEHYRLAYFKAPPEGTNTAPLAAFGWGPDVPARTACEFNLPALKWPDDPADAAAWVAQWAGAFDVARVTRKFYEEYKSRFERLQASITALEGEDRKMFTQTLMNRLLFLRFAERKGWFAFPAARPTRNYLGDLFAAGGIGKKSVYAARLRPLFFEALAIEGRQQSDAIGKVHFLNGGLFEPSKLDQQVSDIPDDALAPIISPEGLFYRYNFTVEESTPLDIEVAVDPEMLGKVFEELVTGRHESGSYYTPRPVVSFMCREALKGHLQDKTTAPPDALASFVDRHEVAGLTEAHGQQIRHALDSLKAVDPACGSGAYLLGLMHELTALYRLLQNEKLVPDSRTLYDLKLRIISHNLYGVDKDPFATHIAMLRLWLSLAVDSDQPLPLPNLDFKIETGDSLTGPCDPIGTDLHTNLIYKLAEKAVRLKEEYLQSHGEEKTRLKAEIENYRQTIARELHHEKGTGRVIDWYAQFTEVFASPSPFETTLDGRFGFAADAMPQREFKVATAPIRGGFDVVLTNPPYVRHGLIKELKPMLKKVYAAQFTGTADLYVFFYLRALQLLATGGTLVFISSNKWFRARYGVKLRSLIASTTSVGIILDFHDLPVFESAMAYPMIFVAAKRPPTEFHHPIIAEPPSLAPPYPDVGSIIRSFGRELVPLALAADGRWELSGSGALDKIQKMRNAGIPLKQLVSNGIYAGIKTGLNRAFIIGPSLRQELIAADRASADIIKPFIKGKDITKWGTPKFERFIIYTPHGIDITGYRAIRGYLTSFRAELLERALDQEWYELQQPQLAFTPAFQRTKIVYPNVSLGSRFTMDRGAYLDMTAFCICSDDLYLLGVLNSSLMTFYFAHHGIERRGGYQEYKTQYVKELPIPDASTSDRAIIAALAQKCLDAQGIGCEALEKEIDERVAALYGVELSDVVGTQRPAPIYDTKGYLIHRVIPKLSAAVPRFAYFSRKAVEEALKGHRGEYKPESLNRYLHELMAEGVIFDAGRGWYSTLSETFLLDREPVRGLVELLEKRFPFLDFSCWSTAQIAAYSHHQLARFVSFVHVERDAMESVADAVRETGQTAYINPAVAEVGKNVRLSNGAVIVRPAISRAPVDGKYATIEKILVDLYVELRSLRLMDEAEYRRIVENVLTHGRILISTTATYAEDRRSTHAKQIFPSIIY